MSNEVHRKKIDIKWECYYLTAPKERLAAMWHNWQWFGKYVWGEDIEIEGLEPRD